MRVWGKAPIGHKETVAVARAALAGKSRRELLKEAIKTLLSDAHADRVGIWVECTEEAQWSGGPVHSFRGIVAEKEGDATPLEWSRLSPQSPLPSELLVGLQTIEQDLSELRDAPLIGALVEMRHVLWVPVAARGHLRGVVFAGTRKKQAHMPRALLESVAAELALTMELDDERGLGRERQESMRRAVAAFVGSAPPNEILAGIVKELTQPGGARGPNVFAAIGRLVDAPGARKIAVPTAPSIRFTWQSGAAPWIRALENEEFSGVWRDALVSRHVVGAEPRNASSSPGDVARVVALPLEADGQSLGVLVVGMRKDTASLAALERLELSAALAGAVLLQVKRSEEAAERDLRQHALFVLLGATTVVVADDGTIVGHSENAPSLLGAARQHLPEDSTASPENFYDLFSALEIPPVKAWLQKVLAVGPFLSASGEIFPEAQLRNGTRVRLRTLHADPQQATILVENLRPRAEAAPTQHGLTEILNVIEWLEEGVVLFGVKQEIRAVNSRFGQIVGLTPEELAGIKSLDDLVSTLASRAADAGSFAESWYSLARSTEGATREELQLVRPLPRLLERAVRPILDAKGGLIGRVEIYRDLTAQRLFQSKLLQTDKLAELGQMVTGIAHELSNPLTSILGYAQRLLLRRDSLGDCHEARQIFQEAERASAILRQLLSSARESRPERRRVALNQVVSRTLELQRFNLAADKIRVQLDLEPVLPFILGDAGQLQQVLVNLIGNARHAIEEQAKGGTIYIKTQRIAEKRVLLEVRDDGPGIPPAIQARIFDPFFTTKPAGVGTGLGLSIVLGIVREHGGRLHLTSNVGQGTIFAIEFPAMSALEMPAPAAGGSLLRPRPELLPTSEVLDTVSAGASLGPWAGARVLVLEDEPTVARLIADVLDDEGLRVDVLHDPREALHRVASEDYTLAICDMKMPELDGEHFFQALAHAKNPLRERFLFVTGDVLAAHTRDFLERNHLPHVAKPFRVEELTAKIRDLLEATAPHEPAHISAVKKNAART